MKKGEQVSGQMRKKQALCRNAQLLASLSRYEEVIAIANRTLEFGFLKYKKTLCHMTKGSD
jgi:hypothetical protein